MVGMGLGASNGKLGAIAGFPWGLSEGDPGVRVVAYNGYTMMRRDTRANLIFLLVFLGVSLPGAVILFKKKLDPTAAPLGMPDFVRKRLPYMVPLPTPDDQVIRVVPLLTGEWVSELARERAGGAAVLTRGPLPITSGDRVVQLVAMRDEAPGASVFVLAWEGGYGEDAARYRVTATSAGEPVMGRVVSATAIPMPVPVKRELMSGGYIKPSANVTWIEVRFDAPLKAMGPLTLRVEYAGGAESPATELKVEGK